MSDLLDFDDVAGDGATLDALDRERLAARWNFGPAPLAAGAALLRANDPRALPGVPGAAAFLAPDDVPSLRNAGAVGTDALVALMLCLWAPMPSRVRAAESLAGMPVTAALYVALREVVDGPKIAVRVPAEKVLADVAPQIRGALKEPSDRLRLWGVQLREGRRNPLQRQELQRAMAAGDAHPALGFLVRDDGSYLAGLLPPVHDAARAPLLPYLLATARTDHEPARDKVFGIFQRRWREVAQPSLSAVARTPFKAKDAALAVSAVRALGAMGASDALAAAAAFGVPTARIAAFAEFAKRPFDGDRALLDAVVARAAVDADAAVRRAAEGLRPAAVPSGA